MKTISWNKFKDLSISKHIKETHPQKGIPLNELLPYYPNKIDFYKTADELNIDHAKVFGVGNMLESFPPKFNFPSNYCLKPLKGCGSRGVFLMKGDLNLKDFKKYNPSQIQEEYLKYYKHKVGYSHEYLIEELLLDDKGEIPNDFKVYTFRDKIGCIIQIKRNPKGEDKCVFYDDNWDIIEGNTLLPKPSKVAQTKLINISLETIKHLNVNFKRMDLYIIKDNVLLGEITSTPAGGKFSKWFKSIDQGIELDKYLGYLIENLKI